MRLRAMKRGGVSGRVIVVVMVVYMDDWKIFLVCEFCGMGLGNGDEWESCGTCNFEKGGNGR